MNTIHTGTRDSGILDVDTRSQSLSHPTYKLSLNWQAHKSSSKLQGVSDSHQNSIFPTGRYSLYIIDLGKTCKPCL